MPQTPDRPTRSDSEFAELFARKARTPLRGFLPGRRVWNAVGGSVAVVLVLVGATAVISRIDWSGGPDKVTTASAKKTGTKEKGAAGGSGAPTATAHSSAPAGTKQDKTSGTAPLPAAGGDTSGGGSGSGGSGTTGGDSGTTAESPDTGSHRTTSSPTTPTGYLWSDGSVDTTDNNSYWDQSIVTVKSTKSLSSLKVVVKIIQTGGVVNTGTWTSLGDQVTVASAASGSEVDYVMTLKSGITLSPGTYVFKLQYNHAQGNRDAGGDRYNVTATSTTSDDEFLKGGF
ncbi:hypothetical protein SAMN04487983_1001135 [Streptomyces sp. yr375]|uniref:hypothetical protein n=1 Tax=Streptomyces sp. yr375 TaxID=1761906 RepID=UPI0008C5DCBB|nr:hypothetical protein [Streptomyces sp. yr375]SEP62448.1 hypothetical protein SAMN04487983_1001135 [Streptomyces sp. yr375]